MERINNKHGQRLYVIGNGFDCHHDIKSRYAHFREYVEENNPDLYDTLEQYFDYDFLWSQFEIALSEIDMEEIKEECSNSVVSMTSDEWRDRDWHVFGQEVGSRLELVTTELKKEFLNWILTLEIPHHPEKMVELDINARFLNFNYTPTLQYLYNVPAGNIKYIHNQAVNKESNLILGHGKDPNTLPKHSGVAGEDADYVYEQGYELIDSYYWETYKPSAQVINEMDDYFTSLKEVTCVHVYGHSLSEVDRPYFEKLVMSVDKNAEWTVSCYDPKEEVDKRAFLTSIGVPQDKQHFISLNDLLRTKIQMELF